jgi:hypothetical protein
MTGIKKALLASALIAASVFAASGPALAHGHVHVGVAIGGPVFWPGYYPYPAPYPYYPPVVAVPSAPTTYIEQAPTQASSDGGNWWYYCDASNAYYPYVKDCSSGWQRVTPQPPR